MSLRVTHKKTNLLDGSIRDKAHKLLRFLKLNIKVRSESLLILGSAQENRTTFDQSEVNEVNQAKVQSLNFRLMGHKLWRLK